MRRGYGRDIDRVQAWAQAALDITIPGGGYGETLHTTINAEVTLDAQQLGALAYTATTTVRTRLDERQNLKLMSCAAHVDYYGDSDGDCTIYGHANANDVVDNDCGGNLCGNSSTQIPTIQL